MDSMSILVKNVDNIKCSDFQLCEPEQCNILIKNQASKLKIITQNIRSVSCNLSDFNVLLARIDMNIDIIILTECWLASIPNIPQIAGFNSHSTSQLYNQNDGLITYYRDSLSCKTYEPKIKDASCIITIIQNYIIIIAIYRSPSFHNIIPFLNSLNEILVSFNNHKNVIITGDLNLNIADPSDSRAAEYLELIAMHGILPAYTLPTRGNSCLDHFMLRTSFSCQTLIIENSLTDHLTILLCMDTKQTNTKYSKTITQINYPEIHSAMKSADFSKIYSTDDCNIGTDYLIGIISKIVFCNTLTSLIPKRRATRKPWITVGLIRCMKNRDRMHMKLRKQPHNAILNKTYKRYRNFCKSILKKAKTNYEKEQLKIAGKSNNTKIIWKIINEVTSYKTTPKLSHELLEIAASPSASVGIINSFFANVGRSLAQCITPDSSTLTSNSRTVNSMAMLDTDEPEIMAIITSLKSGTSVGWDGISSNVLIQNKETLTPVITYLVNLSLRTGCFPTALKHAIIVPIHKNGDKGVVGNYRPISILTSLSKIFEKVINKRIIEYLELNHLLSSNQYGFRRGKSTSEAVLKLTDFVTKNLDSKKKTLAIFLDLAKAFDSVSIPKLLDKLEHLGIRGIQHKLITNYMSGRTQSVKVSDHVSDPLPVNYGVPQGSILGPTLFLAYINDLCELSMRQCSILTYADDTAIMVEGDSWEETYVLAQSAFDTVSSWLRSNLLSLNIAKTKYITFGIRAALHNECFSIIGHKSASCAISPSSCCCAVLEKVNSIKYLGIVIDDRLSFIPHITEVTTRIRKLTAVFRAIRDSAEWDVVRMLYYSICQSIITYCITSWGGSYKTHMLQLERAQRGLLKCSTSRPYRYPTVDLYKECQVLTVRQLFVQHAVLHQHTLTKYNPSAPTKRSSHNICSVPRVNSAFAGKFLYFMGPFLYNKMNKDNNINALTLFELKKTLFTNLNGLSYDNTENLLAALK